MTTTPTSICRPLAPEDISAGCYVAVLSVTAEYMPLWAIFDWSPCDHPEPIRLTWLPCDPQPMKVKQVCLPYVLVRECDGKLRTLDVRRYRLGRLTDEYGKHAWAKLKAQASERARRKRKKR